MTWLRRIVTVPVMTAVMVSMLVLGPQLLVVGPLAGLAARSSRPVRTVALALAYAFIELRTLIQLAIGDVDCDRLMGDFLTAAYAAVRRILDVEVVLDPSSTTPAQIPRRRAGDRAVTTLRTGRHRVGGLAADGAVPAAGANSAQGRPAREPVLDFAGALGCLCFISRGAARPSSDSRSGRVAGRRAGSAAVPRRRQLQLAAWHAAIAELRSTGRIREATRAFRQSYTLPPRTGGAAAAVTGAPSANVLVLTHNGFCADGRARPWWQLPIHRQLLVRTALVPAAQLPPPDQLTRGWNEPGPKSMPGSPAALTSPVNHREVIR